MTKSKISIIIPFSNTEKYIGRCIKSVLAQSFSVFEVILVADHSTDNSKKIINGLIRNDKRFRLVELDTHGPSNARNLGIRKADSKYIYFLDSDDWIEDDCLFKLFSKIEQDQSQICLLNFNVVDDRQQYVKSKIKTPNLPNKSLSGMDALRLLLVGKINHYPWTMLINRDFLLNRSIEFPSGRLYEDFATTYKLFAEASRISFLNQVMYHYVQHDRSITHTVRLQDAKDILLTISEMDSYFRNTGIKTVLISKYQLPRLFIAYRVTCIAQDKDTQLNRIVYKLIINKIKQNKLFNQLSFRTKIKIILLQTGILKLFYKMK